ncbi:MAG: glutamate synthase-related protein [Chloroflexota bacterium]
MTASSTRYHIHTLPAPAPPGGYPAQFHLEEGGAYVKYGHPVFSGSAQRGDEHWTAELITQTWYQAETGRIPISGAGYGGKFAGPGFDGIWLDMSEIVRPTRDGIHGRESISTQVDLGGGLMRLEFAADGSLKSALPPVVSLPLPLLLGPLLQPLPGRGALQALAQAAAQLDGLALIYAEEYGPDLAQWGAHLAPRLMDADLESLPPDWPFRYLEIEIDDPARALAAHAAACQRWPGVVIALRLALSETAAAQAVEWARAGVGVLHLFADEVALDAQGRSLPEALHQVHTHLVEAALRDQVCLLASGGIAAAEHVAKTLACGADLVAVDFILQVAWGCALWADKGKCPVESQELDPEWGAQRLVNLVNAWRDQLLEALGAMGLREVRRLRGEIGRTIWNNSEEAQFRAGLGGSVPRACYPRLPQPNGGEGDFRWPLALLLASQQQARSGGPPNGDLEYRLGASEGGFDRLAFAFELEPGYDPREVPWADPAGCDLRLPLNRREPERPELALPLPWYGAGMSYGSISLPVMLARARAAAHLGTFISTGEGGYPEELEPYAGHVITQVATGLFGVSEASLLRARLIEIKYAQGAKPGLGGHLLGNKNTATVARLRQAVQGTSLFSPFPFHSVYSVEDHKKHVDWLKQVNPRALVSVKVSTPTDVDMVAVGSYYAGAHIVHLDGAYGGTGAAPEIAKKNIAMPIEYALPRVHRFLVDEGIRQEITLMASGGLRSAWDVAKAIALGADGAVIGTAELVALGCIRIAQCEKGLGCPFGITTTDPEHASKIDADLGFQQITNLYRSWQWQLAGILQRLDLASVAELRGRSDLLRYLE